jgi:hypothetical protein
VVVVDLLVKLLCCFVALLLCWSRMAGAAQYGFWPT